MCRCWCWGSEAPHSGGDAPGTIAYRVPYPPRVVNRGFFLDLQPPIVTPDFLRGTGCSVGSIFVVPFVLIVRSTGSSAVTLVNVALTFVDTLGVYAPVIALGPSTLEDRFGRLTVPRSDRRFFDLVYESECTTRQTGVLAVEVTTSFKGETSSSTLRLQVQ
jgi:hypothetical protein